MEDNKETNIETSPKKKKKLDASITTFIVSVGIIFLLMVVCFILTKTLPAGKYEDGVYHEITGKDFPFWKFILSPFLMFGGEGGTTVALIIAFLFVISGVMAMMEKGKIMNYALDRLVGRFGKRKYLLLCIIILFFMTLGSLVGTFEEIVPFVPLIIILTAKLGFDKFVGLGTSLLAVGCGFSCGILNPFTVGAAQKLADVPMFSGVWLRIVSFVLVYILLVTCVLLRARKNEKENISNTVEIEKIEYNPNLSKAGIAFGISLGIGFILVIVSIFVPAIQDFSLVFLAVGFLIGGILAAKFAKIPLKDSLKAFLNGVVSMLPAAFMLMLASSIRYILSDSMRMATILHLIINATNNVPKVVMVLIIYGIVLLFNLFIPSGSAKALLLIPILAPLAVHKDISRSLVILAFAFGDGFSNLVYPTNPVLLISLNLSDTSYGKYLKNTWPFFLCLLVLSVCILLFGFAVNYGPF